MEISESVREEAEKILEGYVAWIPNEPWPKLVEDIAKAIQERENYIKIQDDHKLYQANKIKALEKRLEDAETLVKMYQSGASIQLLQKELEEKEALIKELCGALKESRDQAENYAIDWWDRFEHPSNQREHEYNQDVVKKADEALEKAKQAGVIDG